MDDRSEAVKKVYYRWMAHEDCAMPQFVTFKKEIFWDVNEFTLPINPTDIIELLMGEKLGTNILALFSMVVGRLSWELPIVNWQEDTWECGFYVMNLILGGPHMFPLCNSSECSALTTIPTIIQASNKRKKTTKAPVEQSNVAKEKADIRKRLHLSKEDMDDRLEAVKKVYYRWMAHKDCAMPQFVTFKKEILWDVNEFTLPINPTHIIKLLTGEKLGTNILALFSRYKEVTRRCLEALELKGGDGGSCKLLRWLLGDVIEVLEAPRNLVWKPGAVER
ncbi:hypothetical protein Tco_0189896 [Tanacetum coccineum]